MKPAGQWQAPVLKWQRPPWRQRHLDLQPGPKVPTRHPEGANQRPAEGETSCITVCFVRLSTSTHGAGSLVHSNQACSCTPPSLGGTVPGQLNTGTAGCSSLRTCQQDTLGKEKRKKKLRCFDVKCWLNNCLLIFVFKNPVAPSSPSLLR